MENTGSLGHMMPHVQKFQYAERAMEEIAPSSEARLDAYLSVLKPRLLGLIVPDDENLVIIGKHIKLTLHSLRTKFFQYFEASVSR